MRGGEERSNGTKDRYSLIPLLMRRRAIRWSDKTGQKKNRDEKQISR